MIVVERVDHLPSVALPDDQPQVAQHPELLGNGGLGHVQVFGEDAYRAGPRSETAEDAHPTRGRERLHCLGDRSSGLGREEREVWFCAVTHAYIIACIVMNKSTGVSGHGPRDRSLGEISRV